MRSIRYGMAAGASLLLASVFLGAGSAFAKSGGMPQLDFKDFAPQLVWLAILFVVLYLIMSRLAVPAISDTLEKRQAKIQADLDAAEKANDATRESLTTYEQRLYDAREEARRLTRERGEADNAALAQRLGEVGERLGGQIAEAEKRIAGQRATVMAGLEQIGTDIAASVYAKLAGQPADQSALAAKVAAAKGSR
jgi:F-type H+-transporting ATPase subunit b